ncbi:hypothetical protein GW17_00058643, partial [Ensete ventricosum]
MIFIAQISASAKSTKREAMMSHAFATPLAIPNPKPRDTHRSALGRLGPSLRPIVRLAAVSTAAAAPPLERRKLDLLQAVQETQRGLAATADQRSAVEEALVSPLASQVCVEEYDAGSPVNLSVLDGTWRLNYTSASDVLVLFEAGARLPFLQVLLTLLPTVFSPSLSGGISLAAAREKEEEVEEEAEEKGEPEDLVLLSLDDPDPSSPSLTGRRRCAPFFSSSPHTRSCLLSVFSSSEATRRRRGR